MDKVIARLRWLRAWFVGWYVVEAVVGIWVAAWVIEGLRSTSALRVPLRAAHPAMVATSGLLATFAILAVVLWVFHALLRLRAWARLVLLIAGWISVLGAVSGLASTGSLAELAYWVPGWPQGLDLGGLASVGVVTNVVKLLVWGYVIAVLQLDHRVRDAFLAAAPGA